jgi:hypothetical protein
MKLYRSIDCVPANDIARPVGQDRPKVFGQELAECFARANDESGSRLTRFGTVSTAAR